METGRNASFNGYLKTACDYVHLNPVRAGLVGPEDRLLAYPWSSLVWYLSAPEHRPAWIRVDRLLGEHGIQQDSAAGRQEFEAHLERRRREEDEAALRVFRRGWCLGSEEFKCSLAAPKAPEPCFTTGCNPMKNQQNQHPAHARKWNSDLWLTFPRRPVPAGRCRALHLPAL